MHSDQVKEKIGHQQHIKNSILFNISIIERNSEFNPLLLHEKC